MTKMIRKQIYIQRRQEALLKRLAKSGAKTRMKKVQADMITRASEASPTVKILLWKSGFEHSGKQGGICPLLTPDEGRKR